MTELKFCGLTRAGDAGQAASLGARYAGVIFAGGPRRLDAAAARLVLDAATAIAPGVRRVGVFGGQTPSEIGAIAREARLDVVQLHADPGAAAIAAVHATFDGLVWGALRVAAGQATLPAEAAALFEAADGVVLDARVDGMLGGTGTAVAWEALVGPLAEVRGVTPLVLAGGLRAETVAAAIRALAPEVVDVSSGVESAPGVKDPERMRAFADAVRAEGVA